MLQILYFLVPSVWNSNMILYIGCGGFDKACTADCQYLNNCPGMCLISFSFKYSSKNIATLSCNFVHIRLQFRAFCRIHPLSSLARHYLCYNMERISVVGVSKESRDLIVHANLREQCLSW